jgi:long-chain fatty acid transport protein
MKKSGLFCSLFVFLLVTFSLKAGGFQTNFQGQKQAGMGNAGTGTVLDASSIFFNPGAVAFLDTVFSFNVNIHSVLSQTLYLENDPGTYSTEMRHSSNTPFSGYAAYKKKSNGRFSFGLGIYTPFGNKAKWDPDWKGQFIIRTMSLETVFFQPAVSCKLTDKLGIGAGFIYATGRMDLQQSLPYQFSDGHYASSSLSGNASGVGYNAGLFYKACDKLSLGINYRSAVNLIFSGGSALFDVPVSLVSFFPSTSFASKIVLPSVWSIGAGYKCGKFLFACDINYVGWSSYDSLRIGFADHSQYLQNIQSARMYKNVFQYHLGAQYKLNANIQTRIGVYVDPSPVQAGYVTPDDPDANKIGLSCGATFKMGKHVNIDASLLYEEGMQRTDANLETQFSGTYKSRAVIPGIGLQIML